MEISSIFMAFFKCLTYNKYIYCLNVDLVCMYLCMYVYVCMYVCICMYVCMYVCMCVCICMYVYVRMCVYVCISAPSRSLVHRSFTDCSSLCVI